MSLLNFLVRYYPVYHLSPTDEIQARKAVEFASSHDKATAFWVIQDVSNPVYSSYLTLEFIKNVHIKEGKQVLLLSDNLSPPSVETIRALNINCVYFAGPWYNALVMVRQVNTMFSQAERPIVILTDSAVDSAILKRGKTDMEGVYLTHQMNANTFNEVKYGLYGEDGAEIIKKLINEANENFSTYVDKKPIEIFLGIHSVKQARSAIIAVMKQKVTRGKEFTINNQTYRFNFEGKRENASFHIWVVKNGKFTEVATD